MDGSLAFKFDAAQRFGEYTAVQAEKKLKLSGGVPEARKPNGISKWKSTGTWGFGHTYTEIENIINETAFN